jgi:hypothetical protein
VLLAAICIGIMQQCKKYPEDDVVIQWHRVKKRIIGLGWDPYEFLINGVDSFSVLKTDTAYCRYIFSDANDGANLPGLVIISKIDTIGLYGSWYLIDKKKKIKIMAPYDPSGRYVYGPYGFSGELDWTIKKLVDEEMWLEIDFQQKNYLVKFKKRHQ